MTDPVVVYLTALDIRLDEMANDHTTFALNVHVYLSAIRVARQGGFEGD